MEQYEIYNILNGSSASNPVPKKLFKVNDLSGSQYSTKKNIRFKTPILRSCLCYYMMCVLF